MSTSTTFNTFKQVYDTYQNQGSNRPSKAQTLTDTYNNIRSSVAGESTYLLQDLTPGTTYQLTFNIQRRLNGGTTEADWETVASGLTPTDVAGLDPSDTAITTGNFFYSADEPKLLYFKTLASDNSAIQGQHFDGREPDLAPPSDAEYNAFASSAFRYLSFDSRGVYSQTAANRATSSFDAYLFIFEKLDGVTHNNQYFTNSIRPRGATSTDPVFVGYTGDDQTTGFKRLADVQRASISPVRIELTAADFEETSTTFPVVPGKPGSQDASTGGALAIDKEFYIAVCLYNTSANYWVKDPANGFLQWYTHLIPKGGVYTVTLGAYEGSDDVNYHRSTMMKVNIDGLSVGAGGASDAGNELIRIVITATPHVGS